MSDNESEHSDSESELDLYRKPAYILVAVDCHKSMFPDGFRTVLSACFKVLDNMIFNKSTKQKIAIMLYHQDKTKRTLIDFDTPISDGYFKLKEALDMHCPSDYDGYSFAEFLLECKLQLKRVKNKEVSKYLFFVTNHEDPSDGDGPKKVHALEEFRNMDYLKFELLILSPEFDTNPFYNEVSNILQRTWNHQYNEEFLVLKLLDTIQSNLSYRKVKLYLNPWDTSNQIGNIQCRLRKYIMPATLKQGIKMTRDGKHEVVTQKVVATEERKESIILNSLTLECEPSKIKRLKEIESVPVGITLLHASKKRHSLQNLNYKVPHLLSPVSKNDEKFITLWDSCVNNGLHLTCNIKYTAVGNVCPCELFPKMVNKEKQFLVISLPSVENYLQQKPQVAADNIKIRPEISELMKSFIEQATITDYNMEKYRPFKFREQMKYLKQELLGSNFQWDDKEYPDFVEDKLYDGNPEKFLEKLEAEFPSDQGTKRNAKKAGVGRGRPSKKTKN